MYGTKAMTDAHLMLSDGDAIGQYLAYRCGGGNYFGFLLIFP